MERKYIIDHTNHSILRQSNYEYSVEEIRDNMLNYDTYFDPRRYVLALEYIYKCNIIIFSK